VTYIIVNKSDGTIHVFTPSNRRLFFPDIKGDVAQVLINTIDSTKRSVKEYTDAYKRTFIRCPSTKDYIAYAESNCC